ncbi:L,D-transpeptidase family protein [Agarivorans sp. TSD2052]|uniref:L,D-transpeptidase family protein n=1 Tax=Agarivorans sp. TSD2052 TaxID=2937286 RepID=UPI00200DF11A|nr:L,D-transpeptidase family protein [Agarivorans sp. TSD2052]UPW20733.1 L,D-transpeptidase family protein [Agarivorans sp. TSD2052]
MLLGIISALFCINVAAAVDILGPSEQPSNVFKQANSQPRTVQVNSQQPTAEATELAVGERLLSRLNWPNNTSRLVTNVDDYQVIYPELQRSIQQFHPQPLWYGYAKARNARDQIQWLLLELSLAGGPDALASWLSQINAIDSSNPQWDRLYTDAFLGLMAFYQQLIGLDYAQSMALSHINQLSLQLLIDEPWLASLSHERVYQQLAGLRGDLDIERLRFRQQMLHWLNVEKNRAPSEAIDFGPLIRLGSNDFRVPKVRQRLLEFDPRNHFLEVDLPLMDTETVAALKRFQLQHGLKTDGIVGKDTLYWLNFKPIDRSKMLAKNLLREQLLKGYMQASAQQRIVVNVPAYQMSYINQGSELFQSKVVVGRASRATPLLVSEISSVVINPYWNVPRTIVRKDIIPKLRQDPSYVERKRFELFDYDGQAIPSEQVDWTLVKDTGAFPYRMRQRPGPGNALGGYKFHFDNQFAVYLHDTSSPELFSEFQRDFSSGCVRVEAAEVLAEQLLKQAGYSESYKQRIVAKGKPKWVRLRQKVPVYLVYFTSWFDETGGLHYRKDIYNFDPSVKQLSS